MMKILAQVFLLSSMLFYTGTVLGNDIIEIKEWPVPWENTRPRDPYVDTRGRVWFVGQKGDYIAYFASLNGSYKRFELKSGTGPHNLLVDGEGQVGKSGSEPTRIQSDAQRYANIPVPLR